LVPKFPVYSFFISISKRLPGGHVIRLAVKKLTTIQDAQSLLQTAVGVEFGTLPPYLYALYSIPPGTNAGSSQLIRSVALQEMIHMCLACNILNALGGNPVIQVQAYPGPLPGDIDDRSVL
jgi:hypothetical protein